ncbi:MAG: hypothetical protein ABFS08_01100 [Pseudomonadota bacterium]
MTSVIRALTATALLAGISHSAIADNRVPEKLAETISPSYRSGNINSSSGTQFVWVKRIEGRDSEGRKQLLFSDQQGALLPLNRLSHANKLINPLKVEKKGHYQKLRLQLADKMLTINNNGMVQQPLPNGVTSNMLLRGGLEINKFEVIATNLRL